MKSVLKTGVDWTFLVLEAIADELEVVHALQGRYRWVAWRQGIDGLRRIELEKAQYALRRRTALLKHRKLIVEKKTSGRLRLQLTESGKKAFLKKILRNAPLRTDGKRIMIVFDVPERARKERDRLRAFLRSSGFVRLQRSVWVTKKDVSDALEKWIRAAAVGRWIRVFIVEDPR